MICSQVFTALITPFDSKGNVDFDGFVFHIKRQQEAGIAGLVVLGTTGEAAALLPHEKESLVKLARQESHLPLMVGCSAASTMQTVDNIAKAASWGADSVLVTPPYYVKPTQEGIVKHFEEISKASPVPILVYNNPSRVGVNIEVETLRRIANFPRIGGVKECSENVAQISDILYTLKKEHPEFVVICGDDMLTATFMALGGDGVISGGASVIPDEMVALVNASNEIEKAREINYSLIPLFKAFRLETSPIAIKAALNLMGLPAGNPRLPLTPLNPKNLAALEQWLSVTQPF